MEINAEQQEQHGSQKKFKKQRDTQAQKTLSRNATSHEPAVTPILSCPGQIVVCLLSWPCLERNHTRAHGIAQLSPLNTNRPLTHASLANTESAPVTQTCTENIGLADALHRKCMLGAIFPDCPCGWYKQTADHCGGLRCRVCGCYEVEISTQQRDLIDKRDRS